MSRNDVYLRGSVYWCWIKDHTGTWVRKSTGRRDKAAARLEKKRLERFYADPAHFSALSARLDDALDAMLTATTAKGRSPKTVRSYGIHAGHVLRIFGQEALLSSVTADAVDAYIKQRLSEHVTKTRKVQPHTVHKELVVLRKALKIAKRKGKFTADVSEVVPEFSPQYQPRKTFLTLAQLHLLLAQFGTPRAAHVAFVVATGARKSEALRAEKSDIQAPYVALRGTKTAKAARVVVVAAPFLPFLELAAAGGRAKGPMFDPWGNAHRDIWAACLRAGVPLVSWNDLRRTHGSWLKQAGVPESDIADQLGHSGVTMVRRVYGVDVPEALAKRLSEHFCDRTTTAQTESVHADDQAENKPTDRN